MCCVIQCVWAQPLNAKVDVTFDVLGGVWRLRILQPSIPLDLPRLLPPQKTTLINHGSCQEVGLKKRTWTSNFQLPFFRGKKSSHIWSTKWLMVQSQHMCFWAGSCMCHKGLACHGCSKFGFVVFVWQDPLRLICFDGELVEWNLKMQIFIYKYIWCYTLGVFCPSNSGKWWLIWRSIWIPSTM